MLFNMLYSIYIYYKLLDRYNMIVQGVLNLCFTILLLGDLCGSRWERPEVLHGLHLPAEALR